MNVFVLALIIQIDPNIILEIPWQFSSMKDCKEAMAVIIKEAPEQKSKLRCFQWVMEKGKEV